MLTYLLFGLGLVLLIKGADYLIDGSVSLSRRLRVSELTIGLTVVAFGTSMPELTVNLLSALKGTGGITVGNVIGSNIANLALILGVAGFWGVLPIGRSMLQREIPLSLAGAALVYLLVVALAPSELYLSRLTGGIFLAGFALFLYWIWRGARSGEELLAEEEVAEHHHGLPAAIGLAAIGLVGLIGGGKLIVDNAVIIATSWGISESLIGLTLVAVGTSLPELAASIAAMRKGKSDLLIGNIIGSNVFNLFWVLGASVLIQPITYPAALREDIAILIGLTLLLAGLPWLNKKLVLARWQTGLFLLLYAVYIGYIVYRG
jgi:cation:H+ antiporter